MLSYVPIPPPTAADLWSHVFGNPNPVEVEIGSGTGIFLAAAARQSPNTNFYGIEKAHNLAVALGAKLDRLDLPNALALNGDAVYVVEHFLPPGSVQAFHIYFPDPWWKRKHHRRRIFTAPFVRGLARALVDGGYLYVATDVDSVFTLMRSEIGACASFVEEPEKPSPRLAISTFERKGIARGATIWRSAFRKPSGAQQMRGS